MSTSWPLIWTVEPANPNWEGTVGDTVFFTTKAIPDPDYPDEWEAIHDDGMGGPIPPLPPEPEVIEYIVTGGNLDTQFYTLTLEDGLTIEVDDAAVFLPFQDISFEKDGQQFSVNYIFELENSGYDFVYSFVPSSAAFDTRTISLDVDSTSDVPLTGTFTLKTNNNFDAMRNALQQVVQQSEQFLGGLEDGDGTPPELPEPEDNDIIEVKLSIPSKYQDVEKSELFPSDDEEEIDELFRTGREDEAIEKIGNGEGLTKTPRPEVDVPVSISGDTSEDDLQRWFDSLGDNSNE